MTARNRVLPVEIMISHRVPRNKTWGDCGVVRFKGCPWVPNVSSPSIPPWERSSLICIQSKIKAVPKILCQWFGISSLRPCPGSTVLFFAVLLYPSSCLDPAFGVCRVGMLAKATWLLRKENVPIVSANNWERERKGALSLLGLG